MNAIKAHQSEEVGLETGAISDRLERARSQIEKRFLEGGTVLMSVLEVFNDLLKALEQMGTVVDHEKAEEATEELKKTGGLIAALPTQQKTRRTSLAAIRQAAHELAGEVTSMDETLRYLRTFAVAAKITGAGIEDFAGFAVEIAERIQFASTEVQALADRIRNLEALIDHAVSGSQGLSDHEHKIPGIVEDLARNGEAIRAQRNTLADIARKVTELALKVQGRLARTLSSLQIGDVTRQRIEHCQKAFEIAHDQLAGSGLQADDQRRVLLLVTGLVDAQLEAMEQDFKAECAVIVDNIGAFSADVATLMGLQQSMFSTSDNQSNSSVIRQVQNSLASARAVVAEIETSATEAERLSESARLVVHELIESVETIQIVRTDIQYMALNTNLRCGKLGEDGRAINVVTNELRSFSAKLDELSDQALVHLKSLREQANALARANAADDSGVEQSLVARIDLALGHVTDAAEVLEAHMHDVRARGQDVAIKVAATVSGLDFHHEINGILAECIALARDMLVENVTQDGLESVLGAISGAISRVYTMKSERDVHARIFTMPVEEPVANAPADLSDDDLFDDALF